MIASKTTRKLNVNFSLNYAILVVEFCLFISPR